MKNMFKALAMLSFLPTLTGCQAEQQAEPQPPHYQGLEKPVDRSQSKEY